MLIFVQQAISFGSERENNSLGLNLANTMRAEAIRKDQYVEIRRNIMWWNLTPHLELSCLNLLKLSILYSNIDFIYLPCNISPDWKEWGNMIDTASNWWHLSYELSFVLSSAISVTHQELFVKSWTRKFKRLGSNLSVVAIKSQGNSNSKRFVHSESVLNILIYL